MESLIEWAHLVLYMRSKHGDKAMIIDENFGQFEMVRNPLSESHTQLHGAVLCHCPQLQAIDSNSVLQTWRYAIHWIGNSYRP